jgi:type IV pilus assembly protein PilA
MSACRTSITEVYQTGGTPPNANSWGCESGVSSKYVSGLATNANGIVTAVIQNISADVNTKAVTLAPMIGNAIANSSNDMGKGLTGWRCGSSTDGTNLNSKFLPGSCRGS